MCILSAVLKVKSMLNLLKNITTRCAQSPKLKCDNELSKSEDKIKQWATIGLHYFPLDPSVFSERRRISCPAGKLSASQEKAFFMELITQSNNKPLIAQNYRCIHNTIQCALFMEGAKGERKMLWYANSF